MNNFQATEIKKSVIYLQEKLDMFKSKEVVKKIILQRRESMLKRAIKSLFSKI